MILYEGPSRAPGHAPVVAILTGLDRATNNRKIGAGMLQTWILPASTYPGEAEGKRAVCGDCPLSQPNGGGCYVFPPVYMRVWKVWHAGGYPALDIEALDEAVDGRMIRLGAWGDPAMVPSWTWKWLLRNAAGWTGYTHQWRKTWAQDLRELCMASVETREQAAEAQAMGWRTFRIGNRPVEGEFRCPASDEAGHLTTCERCGLCNGTSGITAKSVVIQGHGPLRRGQGRIEW